MQTTRAIEPSLRTAVVDRGSFSSAPPEILSCIFNLCPLPSLLVLRAVCHAWSSVLESDDYCARRLGPCVDEIDHCKVLYDRMHDGELKWEFGDIPNPCWRSGQWDDGYFGDSDGPRQAMFADDEELDDEEFAVAVGETPTEDDRWRWRDVSFVEHMYKIHGIPRHDNYTSFSPLLFSNNPPGEMIRHFFIDQKPFDRSIFDVATDYIHPHRLPIRITHFSPTELDEFVKEKGGNITRERIGSFMDDVDADDVKLEDLYECGGLWTLVALRKYCSVDPSVPSQRGFADPPLCIIEMPPPRGHLRNRDGTQRDLEVEFSCAYRDVQRLGRGSVGFDDISGVQQGYRAVGND
ncbi:hypothetical protein HK405_001632 [Cladochytrium tenue]|nr:hypothetical protein HK405_001632 [Cladochytrium tenue]